MRKLLQMLMVAVLLTGLTVWTAPSAHAANAVSSCSGYVGVTNRIAGCVRESIASVTTTFFDSDHGFYPMVSKAIAGFITLGIAIYGMLLASGQIQKVGPETLIFLTKVALVGFFTQSTPLIYDYAITGMDQLAAIVVQVTPKNGAVNGDGSGTNDFGKIQCLQNMKAVSEQNGKPVVGPWMAMDCLIDTVLGIKVPTSATGGANGTLAVNGPNAYAKNLSGKGLQRGMIFFFFSGMKTSVMGLMLGIIGFIFMWGILSMIIKALMIYIGGYIGITFMIIISPLFIPLVLFRPTKEYFDKWVRITISFALQPIITLLFVSLSITAVDLALSSGDYSVMYRIAGDRSRTPNFNLNSYFDQYGVVVKKPATFLLNRTDANSLLKPLETTDDKTVAPGLQKVAECASTNAIAGSGQSCKDTIAYQMYHDSVDWAKLAAARQPPVVLEDDAQNPEQQLSREILSACIFLGIVVFVMNKLMTIVPYILVDLIGDLGQTPNLSTAATGAGDPKGGGWNGAAGSIGAGFEGGARSRLDGMLQSLRKDTP